MKQPPCPKQVQVGPFSYPIIRDAEAILDRGSGDEFGLCDRAAQRILIRPGLGADVEADTVLHEVLHVVVTASGLDNTDDEKMILALTPVLLDTLRRNPALVTYLLGAHHLKPNK